MVRVYVTEDSLKGYIPKIEDLLWNEQENFDLQKSVMETEVMNDFINRGLKAVYLRNDLVLRNSGTNVSATTTETVSNEDLITRQRFVVNVRSISGNTPKTITLKGSNDKSAYYTIESIEVSETGIKSIIIPQFYNYYTVTVLTSSGAIDYDAYLTETSYDLLHIYKWLMIILTPLADNTENSYSMMLNHFNQKYIETWNTLKIFYDTSESGNPENATELNNSIINVTR